MAKANRKFMENDLFGNSMKPRTLSKKQIKEVNRATKEEKRRIRKALNKIKHGVLWMTKYGLEMILETTSQYKTVKFSVSDCDSKEEAENEMLKWLDKKTELMGNIVNRKVVQLVL